MIISNNMTLGSLFDGIGGFPYAGSFFGIKPLWASEILTQAISVTIRHFPEMKHVGDITRLSGAELEPVDVITFGSPCQDLSTAGKRAGMSGSRSCLFYESIRIIDEMRNATNGEYPKYALWENVPGALSSGSPRGSDFRAVLEAFTKTEVPMPASGRWANAGMVGGDGVNIAWRMLNACMWGVPQRRRRIFLVASFRAGSPTEVLFVEKGLRWNTAPGRKTGQGTPADVERSAGSSVADAGCLNPWETQQSRVFTEDGVSPTLAGADGGGGRNPAGLVIQTEDKDETTGDKEPVAAFLGGAGAKARGVSFSKDISPTLKSAACGFLPPCVCEPEIARTLTARSDGSPNIYSGPNIVAMGVHQNQVGEVSISETAYTLATASNASSRNAPLVCENSGVHPKIAGTLCASGAGLSRPGGMASEPDLCVVQEDKSVLEPSEMSQNQAYERTAYAIQGNMIGRQDHNGPRGVGINEDVSFTLTSTDVCGVAAKLIDSETIPINDRATRHSGCGSGLGVGKPGDPSPTITSSDRHGVMQIHGSYQKAVGALCCGDDKGAGNQYVSQDKCVVSNRTIVRRLTPTECERLQGYPDGWTAFGHDGKDISDTKRYQMLGNSVAIPCVAFVMGNIAAQLRKDGDADGICSGAEGLDESQNQDCA